MIGEMYHKLSADRNNTADVFQHRCAAKQIKKCGNL